MRQLDNVYQPTGGRQKDGAVDFFHKYLAQVDSRLLLMVVVMGGEAMRITIDKLLSANRHDCWGVRPSNVVLSSSSVSTLTFVFSFA